MDLLKKKFTQIKNMFKKNNGIGFSLAEVMIIMLVLSIVMAALTPIITKRANITTSGIAPGTIIMWSDPNHTPNSNQWHLCDGSDMGNNVKAPDLRNRFIMDSSTKAAGYACDTTSNPPECSENGFKLPAKQLPKHTHVPYSTGSGSIYFPNANGTGPAGPVDRGATDNESDVHTHAYNYVNSVTTFRYSSSSYYRYVYTSNPSGNTPNNYSDHNHTIIIDDTASPLPTEGSNNAAMSRGQPYMNMPQYYVLAFYIKT